MTGVIVGVNQEFTSETAAELTAILERRFPGVTFAIMTSASSVAFDFDGPETETPA